jgi:3-mercaptopyruvate sulfurtransferase SseA
LGEFSGLFMERAKRILFLLLVIATTSACNIQTDSSSAPTQIIEPVSTQSTGGLPLTEAEVPRVTVQEAKAALDSGTAIIVDVRDSDSYETSHIVGAINIPLDEFETNPEGLNLDKDQWIITYCT